jgi:N-glycosylase/DNA lyase
MEKIGISNKNFDIDQIANSGQCFRWEPAKTGKYDGYLIRDGADEAKIFKLPDRIMLWCEGWRVEKWLCYLDIETDYGAIIDSIPRKDKYLHAAATGAAGLHILNADLWETMVSFIISQNNNIPRIKKTIAAMCEKLGQERAWECGAYHAFPTPAALADIRELQGLGLGYRDKYIARLAQNVLAGKINLAALQAMPTEAAHTYLKSIFGIGEKVSNCILLFGLGRKEAFPVDTWMKQIIGREYGGKFPVELYPQTAGVIQQYMFYSERAKRGKA